MAYVGPVVKALGLHGMPDKCDKHAGIRRDSMEKFLWLLLDGMVKIAKGDEDSVGLLAEASQVQLRLSGGGCLDAQVILAEAQMDWLLFDDAAETLESARARILATKSNNLMYLGQLYGAEARLFKEVGNFEAARDRQELVLRTCISDQEYVKTLMSRHVVLGAECDTRLGQYTPATAILQSALGNATTEVYEDFKGQQHVMLHLALAEVKLAEGIDLRSKRVLEDCANHVHSALEILHAPRETIFEEVTGACASIQAYNILAKILATLQAGDIRTMHAFDVALICQSEYDDSCCPAFKKAAVDLVKYCFFAIERILSECSAETAKATILGGDHFSFLRGALLDIAEDPEEREIVMPMDHYLWLFSLYSDFLSDHCMNGGCKKTSFYLTAIDVQRKMLMSRLGKCHPYCIDATEILANMHVFAGNWLMASRLATEVVQARIDYIPYYRQRLHETPELLKQQTLKWMRWGREDEPLFQLRGDAPESASTRAASSARAQSVSTPTSVPTRASSTASTASPAATSAPLEAPGGSATTGAPTSLHLDSKTEKEAKLPCFSFESTAPPASSSSPAVDDDLPALVSSDEDGMSPAARSKKTKRKKKKKKKRATTEASPLPGCDDDDDVLPPLVESDEDIPTNTFAPVRSAAAPQAAAPKTSGAPKSSATKKEGTAPAKKAAPAAKPAAAKKPVAAKKAAPAQSKAAPNASPLPFGADIPMQYSGLPELKHRKDDHLRDLPMPDFPPALVSSSDEEGPPVKKAAPKKTATKKAAPKKAAPKKGEEEADDDDLPPLVGSDDEGVGPTNAAKKNIVSTSEKTIKPIPAGLDSVKKAADEEAAGEVEAGQTEGPEGQDIASQLAKRRKRKKVPRLFRPEVPELPTRELDEHGFGCTCCGAVAEPENDGPPNWSDAFVEYESMPKKYAPDEDELEKMEGYVRDLTALQFKLRHRAHSLYPRRALIVYTSHFGLNSAGRDRRPFASPLARSDAIAMSETLKKLHFHVKVVDSVGYTLDSMTKLIQQQLISNCMEEDDLWFHFIGRAVCNMDNDLLVLDASAGTNAVHLPLEWLTKSLTSTVARTVTCTLDSHLAPDLLPLRCSVASVKNKQPPRTEVICENANMEVIIADTNRATTYKPGTMTRLLVSLLGGRTQYLGRSRSLFLEINRSWVTMRRLAFALMKRLKSEEGSEGFYGQFSAPPQDRQLGSMVLSCIPPSACSDVALGSVPDLRNLRYRTPKERRKPHSVH